MPIFQVFFFLNDLFEYFCVKGRKFKPMGLILFLKNIFFAPVTAETWQKHNLILGTDQMTSWFEIAYANLML